MINRIVVLDRQNESKVFDEGDAPSSGRWQGEAGLLSTPPNGQFPMQNVGPVKFEPPTVPVIFVLGKFNKINIFLN